jgi:outer membrane biosynthesis protein TonB
MQRSDETGEDEARPWTRYALMGGTAVLVGAVLLIGLGVMLSGDKDPPRKVQDLTIVTIVPPPPPPPPPPQAEPPPEQKMVEQTPIKQEIIEVKPVDIPKDAPPDANDDPLPGPPALADAGKGPGDLLGKEGGRGFIGGGGGGGGGGGRWGWYASIVQSQIEAALRANEKTRHAVMQVQVKLWSDGMGRVNRVQLVSSTGDTELDAVIRNQVLRGLTLREPPPKDMPMPINMRVIARRPG